MDLWKFYDAQGFHSKHTVAPHQTNQHEKDFLIVESAESSQAYWDNLSLSLFSWHFDMGCFRSTCSLPRTAVSLYVIALTVLGMFECGISSLLVNDWTIHVLPSPTTSLLIYKAHVYHYFSLAMSDSVWSLDVQCTIQPLSIREFWAWIPPPPKHQLGLDFYKMQSSTTWKCMWIPEPWQICSVKARCHGYAWVQRVSHQSAGFCCQSHSCALSREHRQGAGLGLFVSWQRQSDSIE